ncbi:MAG: DUF6082 family protein [Candidatus Nitrosopolaris sp.]
MVLIGFSEVLSLAQSIGIVGTMVLTLYFSKRQLQSLSIHEQTRVLNDLDEKVHETIELMMERPSLQRVLDNVGMTAENEEQMFSYYILSICSHAYAMHQRDVLTDVEWRTYTQWMRNFFQRGTISERWKRIEEDRWFDPAFQNFINKEIIGASGIRK